MEKVTVVLPLMMVLLGYTGMNTKEDNPDNSHSGEEKECTVNTFDETNA